MSIRPIVVQISRAHVSHRKKFDGNAWWIDFLREGMIRKLCGFVVMKWHPRSPLNLRKPAHLFMNKIIATSSLVSSFPPGELVLSCANPRNTTLAPKTVSLLYFVERSHTSRLKGRSYAFYLLRSIPLIQLPNLLFTRCPI